MHIQGTKRAADWNKPATRKHFFSSKQTFLNNEWIIHCFTNEGKKAKNELWNDDTDSPLALYRVYEKLRQFFFHTYSLTCLKEDTLVLLKVIKVWTS